MLILNKIIKNITLIKKLEQDTRKISLKLTLCLRNKNLYLTLLKSLDMKILYLVTNKFNKLTI